MVVFDDKVKEMLHQLEGSDGKIRTTDDMPEDLKNAINLINEKNINIDVGYRPPDDVYIDDESDEELEELNDDDTIEELSETSTNSDVIDDIAETSSSQDMTDLDNIF